MRYRRDYHGLEQAGLRIITDSAGRFSRIITVLGDFITDPKACKHFLSLVCDRNSWREQHPTREALALPRAPMLAPMFTSGFEGCSSTHPSSPRRRSAATGRGVAAEDAGFQTHAEAWA